MCCLPRDIFRDAGFDLSSLSSEHNDPAFVTGLIQLVAITRQHFANALRFILILPTREIGIRRHCLWALGMAVLTLRRILATPAFRHGQDVKISRRSVRAVTRTLVRSNLALKLLFEALTRGFPRVGAGAGS